jgi:hypothetical protein
MNYNDHPSFCFIAPTKYLSWAQHSNTHLVLAHLVDKDDEYANFYKKRREFNDFIMMDNSAYELKVPYSPDSLLRLAEKCGAHAIVLPDYPFQPAQVTIDAAEAFIPMFKDAGYLTFFVPQSETGDKEDWIQAYNWADCNPNIDIIGMSILGIPNALPHIDPAYARVVMTQILIERKLLSGKHHHYLGLNSGPNLEIPSLLAMNALDTIDSSGPIWAAILGHRYTHESDSFQTVSKLKLPVDFDIPLTKDKATLDRILHNIRMTNDLFKRDVTTKKVWYAVE